MNEKSLHKILIIEDDEGLNRLIAKNLRRDGFETDSAFTGQEALSILMNNQNMILLMDYQLPDMTAMDVLAKLTELKWTGPFLIMTGHGDERIAVELMIQGAIDYIVKDANFIEAIPQKIKRACDTLDRQQKLIKAEEEIVRLASFPEVNPSPVLEIELSGHLRYVNPAAKRAFPDIAVKGLKHPFLTGLPEMLTTFQRDNEGVMTREIQMGAEWYHQTISFISDVPSVHIYSLNITSLKQIQKQLASSLKEKEILIREVFHRTKNNIQVMISMLRLQARSQANPEIITVLTDIELKLRAMALVHQKLYESRDLSQLNLKDYFKSLLALIKRSLTNASDQIAFVVEGQDIEVLIDTAIPCGVVVNELVTNAIKHAFPENKKGEVKINLFLTSQNELQIEVSDNGVGLPKGFDLKKDIHLGLESIIDLTRHQLRGDIEFISQKGLVCRIVMKEELYKPRVKL